MMMFEASEAGIAPIFSHHVQQGHRDGEGRALLSIPHNAVDEALARAHTEGHSSVHILYIYIYMCIHRKLLKPNI